ncbi:hypothetical protein HDE_13185 [Halotydeus destructor]|nr:hypothetical protein HDE_13185 [Halotydeus destructor]
MAKLSSKDYKRSVTYSLRLFMFAIVVGFLKNMDAREILFTGSALQIFDYVAELMVQKAACVMGYKATQAAKIKWLTVSAILSAISVILSFSLPLSLLNVVMVIVQLTVIGATLWMRYAIKLRQTPLEPVGKVILSIAKSQAPDEYKGVKKMLKALSEAEESDD